MKTKNEILFGINVIELEQNIKSSTNKICDQARRDISSACSQGKSHIDYIIKEINAGLAVLKEEVNKRLNPEIQTIQTSIDQADLTNLESKIEKERAELARQKGNFEDEVERTKLTFNWSNYKWILFSIFSLCGVDALLNFQSFQALGINLLLSILLAILIAVALGSGAHIVGSRYRATESPQSKKFWLISTIIAASIVFYCLGIIRQKYLDGMGSYATSPILWMAFNLFFFIIALLIASFKLPTKQQELEYEEFKKKQIRISHLKSEIDALDSKFQNAVEDHKKGLQRIKMFIQYKEELHNYINSDNERIVAMCEKEFALKCGNRSA